MPRLLNDQKKQQKTQHSHNRRAHNQFIDVKGQHTQKEQSANNDISQKRQKQQGQKDNNKIATKCQD